MIIKQVDFDGESIRLCTDTPLNNENIFSVVIGVNASGKSRLLGKICNIFLSTNERLSKIYQYNDLSNKAFYNKKYISKNYNEEGSIHYLNYTENCYISYSRGEVTKVKDDSIIEYDISLMIDGYHHMVPMPQRIISVSNCLFDKFPEENITSQISSSFIKLPQFYYNKASSNYNVSYNSKPQNLNDLKSKQISYSILRFIANNSNHVDETLNKLNLECDLHFDLTVKIKTKLIRENDSYSTIEMFDINSTVDSFFIMEYESYEIKREKDIIRNAIYSFLSYCYNCDVSTVDTLILNKNEIKNIKYHYNQSVKDKKSLRAIKKLLLLDVISANDLSFFDSKEMVQTKISEKSSGELCYLHMITAIASEIKNNSIILIDEPELSLHPKWQSEFIPFLHKLFNNYRWCHFILATHSPHIVSSLSKVNSFVTNISYNPLEPIKGIDVHHKSMDYQMARVFGVNSPNNEYLIRIAMNLFTHISKYKSISDEKREEYEFLIKIVMDMDKDSALYDLIITLKEMYKIYG
ncbi:MULTISPECIES: AAA family ATPase [Photobacterium]|nr:MULTISPECIES: AAA family ATPase [Photobacterium]MBY3789397.1 ATP-binding protein [Photobacterium carnosum]